MQRSQRINEALDFAIENEEEAACFYQELAARADENWNREVFEELAAEEQCHKARLVAVKKTGSFVPSAKKMPDLEIADYMVEMKPSPNLGHQDILILAMQKEKAAFRLYSDLARQTDDNEVKKTFLALAQEEARHKLRFEVEYDQFFGQKK